MAQVELKTSQNVILTLTPEEALTLRRLLGFHIVGPDEGPRGTLDHLWLVLRDLDNVLWARDDVMPFITHVMSERLFIEVDPDGRDCSNTDKTPAMEETHA